MLSFLLVNLNIVLLLLVAFLVLRNLMRLVLERRRGVMGSHLRSRLVLAFVAIALFPATVMVIVSYQFVTRGIDDMLGRQVEESLDGAYRLARIYYTATAERSVAHARALAEEIAEGDLLDEAQAVHLRAVIADEQRRHGLATVQIADATGGRLLSMFRGEPIAPAHGSSDADLLEAARRGEAVARVESQGATDIVRGAAPVRGPAGELLAVVLVDSLVLEGPRVWSAQILESFREFRRLRLNKQPFKNLYLITMLLASAVVVFSAAWLGLYLARGITEPIGTLAEATRDVASGRLDVSLPEQGGDEVGTLVRSFNAMTAQLKRGRDALDERRVYIESVLANIGAGVVSIGTDGRIGTINPAALSLLALREDDVLGRAAEDVFAAAGLEEVVPLLADVRAGRLVGGSGVTFQREDGNSLLVTATNLRRGGAEPSGSVLFLEDVSQIQAAQRMEAWREVARRIAHEIKNPLTPIQLSAQRLERRLAGQLGAGDEELLKSCVATIVTEVDGLKRLVNEFSQFARMGGADIAAGNLNTVVEEAMSIYRQARPDIAWTWSPGDSLPPVPIDRDAVRRSIANLLENAVAAVSKTGDGAPAIEVSTRHAAALSRVILEVADNGPGIAPEHRARIFEPYFSTKAEGTGLGLAIVASMAVDHEAYLRVRDNPPRGTRFVIEFPVVAAQHPARAT